MRIETCGFDLFVGTVGENNLTGAAPMPLLGLDNTKDTAVKASKLSCGTEWLSITRQPHNLETRYATQEGASRTRLAADLHLDRGDVNY